MATIIENEKGFKVIEVSFSEIQSWGGLGICDKCNTFITPQYFVAALNWCLCETCYKDFTERQTPYLEDKWYEDKKFEEMKNFLKLEK